MPDTSGSPAPSFLIDGFVTESGDQLDHAIIRYSTAGTMNVSRDNVVLVPSHYMATVEDSAWMIGPGKAIDTDRYFVVSTELFGNGRSSSPSTTAAPHDGPRFPIVTIRDSVHAVYRLLREELGVEHLRAVVGFSMGAMQAFQWAVSYPDFMDLVIPICGNARSYPHGNVRLEGLITTLRLDPAYANGDYDTQPADGVAAFGLAWAPWLYSQEWWRRELWLEVDPGATYESVVDSFRTDFLPGADANDIVLQCRTWQRHDVGTTPGFAGDTRAALRSIQARVLYLPSETDLYFPLGDARFESTAIPNVTLTPIPSLWGHPAGSAVTDADAQFVSRAISGFLTDGENATDETDAVDEADATDDLPGQYLQILALLLAGIANETIGVMSDEALAKIQETFDLALQAISLHSIPGLHEHGWNVVFDIVDNCPDTELSTATRPALELAVTRFSNTTIAQVADWDLLTERYSEFKAAIAARNPSRTTAAINDLYQLPSDAAT